MLASFAYSPVVPIKLAKHAGQLNLLAKMSSVDFEPEQYADEYRERALAMIEKKVEGQEIKAVAPAPRRTG